GTMLFGGPHRRQAEELLKKDVGLTAIHWSTGAEKSEGEQYLRTLGGWFNVEFSEYWDQQSRVRQADPHHPISHGWKDFDLREDGAPCAITAKDMELAPDPVKKK